MDGIGMAFCLLAGLGVKTVGLEHSEHDRCVFCCYSQEMPVTVCACPSVCVAEGITSHFDSTKRQHNMQMSVCLIFFPNT